MLFHLPCQPSVVEIIMQQKLVFYIKEIIFANQVHVIKKVTALSGENSSKQQLGTVSRLFFSGKTSLVVKSKNHMSGQQRSFPIFLLEAPAQH